MQPLESLERSHDAILVGRSSDGDTVAFEVLARRYAPRMRSYAVMILGSTFESDDVVQESLMTAWEKIADLADPVAVRSWLMRIVSRKCIDRMRVRKDHVDVTEIDIAANPDEQPEHVQEVKSAHDALKNALSSLPETQRRCWVLREVGSYSYDEIASEVDLPVSTIRGQLARGRRSLLDAMEEWR